MPISEQKVQKVLKTLSTEKSTGVDMMPPKFVKLAVNHLARLLSKSINNNTKKTVSQKYKGCLSYSSR